MWDLKHCVQTFVCISGFQWPHRPQRLLHRICKPCSWNNLDKNTSSKKCTQFDAIKKAIFEKKVQLCIYCKHFTPVYLTVYILTAPLSFLHTLTYTYMHRQDKMHNCNPKVNKNWKRWILKTRLSVMIIFNYKSILQQAQIQYIYIYIYTHTHTHTHMYIYIYIYI